MLRRLSSSTASSSPSLAAAIGAVATVRPNALAVLAPQQDIQWTYEALDTKARCLACGLEDLGYKKGSVIISDVPNVAENLLLQVALSHLGAAIATPPKDADALAKLCNTYDVKGLVVTDGASLPAVVADGLPHALPTVSLDVAEGARPARGNVNFNELLEHCPPRKDAPAATEESLIGVYGGASLTHSAARALGGDAAATLGVTETDVICCSVTLMHAFGIGSAVGSALNSGAGAAVVLPAVGGIRGCGDPSQRASVTIDVLLSTGTTVMFGDTHTLRAMAAEPVPAARTLSLRTGVIKIGSGNDFLPGVREVPAPKGGAPLPLEYAGVALHGFGKAQ